MDNKPSKHIQEEKNNEIVNPDNAGPSGFSLPGSVQSPKGRPGLSKSEHNLRLITPEDVSNALKSLSFGAPTTINNFNVDMKVPPIKNEGQEHTSATLLDIKQFMASCFKLNKETPLKVSEIPLQAVHTVPVLEGPNHEVPIASCNVQTECLPPPIPPSNQVIVTNLDNKALKEKKKTSGNLSERSDLGIAARDSLSSIGSNVCRICMTRGRERLISPCNCKGSLANVHLSCLERWLNQVGRNHCELCGFSYPAIRTPRYTVLQALRLWFGNPRNRSHLQSDCLIFWLLSTVTAGLLAVCIVGTQYFVIEGNKFGISHRITETAMDFFMAIVLCGYSVTVYLLWKDHYVMWNRWRRANVNVRLLLAPDTNPVPFAPRPRYNVV